MNRKVVLSKTAERKLEKLLYYLLTAWSAKVKSDFVRKLDGRIETIKSFPESFPESKIRKGLRKCVVTKQTTLFYEFDENQIKILTVFDNRQHPDKLDNEI